MSKEQLEFLIVLSVRYTTCIHKPASESQESVTHRIYLFPGARLNGWVNCWEGGGHPTSTSLVLSFFGLEEEDRKKENSMCCLIEYAVLL